jgi:hypothetical protein
MRGMENLVHIFKIDEYSISLCVENRLTERIVRQKMDDALRRGDTALQRSYHQKADALYDGPERGREGEFAKMHASLFDEWGFVALFRDLLAEFPELSDATQQVFVASAASNTDESVDLDRKSPKAEGDANGEAQERGRVIGNRLTLPRYSDLDGLRRHLRHEWMHLDDMLNPEFDFTGRSPWGHLPPSEENVLRERYRAFWCASIDGRIEQSGREPEQPRHCRRAEFDKLFRKFPETWRDSVFGKLWDGPIVPHANLLSMADSREAFQEYAGAEGEDAGDITDVLPVSVGDACPLCRFPTHDWILPTVPNEVGRGFVAGAAEVLARMHARFPNWSPAYGVCERCYERHETESIGA